MKKVLMTAKHLDAGGVETFITGVYPYIDKEKYQIDFVITKNNMENDPKGYFEDDLVSQGAKIYRIAPKSRHIAKAFFDLKKLFQEHPEYEIFHINDGGGAAFPLMVAKLCGIKKCVVHSHNSSSKLPKQNIIMNLFRSYVVKNAKLIACAEEAGKWMFGTKSNVEVLHYGIDTAQFAFNGEYRNQMRESLGITTDQILIGHVGRFNVQKNHTFLIDIFQKICAHVPNAKLLLIGKGELETEVKNKVDRCGLSSNVIFAGTTKEVYKYLSAMDVLLFPSLFEGFSIAHIEAQCNGLPVILSDSLTKECLITDRAQMISLEKGSEHWANIVIDTAHSSNLEQRGKYAAILKDKGFDRQHTAKHLEAIYEGL